jgi:hypothetical protein
MARIHAAGSSGFVKRLPQFARPLDENADACEEVEAP